MKQSLTLICAYIALMLLLFLPPWPEPPEAGAPPSKAIPWDTIAVTDVRMFNFGDHDSIKVDTLYVVEFITREKYEAEVLGWENVQKMRALRRDLEAIKEAVKRKKAKDP